MYPAFVWSVALPAIMDISARAVSLADRPQRGHLGHQCSHAPGRPILHLVFILSQTSAGKTFRQLALRSRDLNLDCLECSTMSQDAPRNASELVGERDGEDVVMQPLLGRFEPRLEPVTIPALRPDQYSPSGLNEQNAQVAVAAFRYLAEDGAVASRDLLGDQPQPGGEVAAFRERFPGADCGHHRAGDDRPEPRHAHQAFTAGIPACK